MYNAPFFVCFVACIGCAVYAMFRRNLERTPAPVTEYHLFHGPNSGCVDCEDK